MIGPPAPMVTIGMPVHNGQLRISRAIESILEQEFEDFELLISDNASTDSTAAICRDYAARDSRIQYFRQDTNIGAFANFCFVLEHARGDYFMWAAHDDRRSSRYLSLALEVFRDNPDAGLVFSYMEVFNFLKGTTQRMQVSECSTGSQFRRILARLTDACPNLVYGLHRTEILRQIPIENYDYFDVYVSHWYTLNSNIRVLPLYLYTMGIEGSRIPYSLSGGPISSSMLRSADRTLYQGHLPRHLALTLRLVEAWIYWRNDRHVNRLRLSGNRVSERSPGGSADGA